MKWGNSMSRRNNLGLAEVVAEKMEDLNLLGEYTMYEFLGKTLIAFEKGDTVFINSEILEPLYNIDEKTDFEKEIIFDVEETLPISEEQQVIRELIGVVAPYEDPLVFLQKLIKELSEEDCGEITKQKHLRLLQTMFDFINNHYDVEFGGTTYYTVQ
jgi:hypothetical protein